MKQILVRLDDEQAEELRRAVFSQGPNATEIVRQALAIRLRLVTAANLGKLLERAHYQEGPAPGRPPAAANGHPQPASAAPAAGDWELEPGP